MVVRQNGWSLGDGIEQSVELTVMLISLRDPVHGVHYMASTIVLGVI